MFDLLLFFGHLSFNSLVPPFHHFIRLFFHGFALICHRTENGWFRFMFGVRSVIVTFLNQI
jgi:hypothetical protein